MAIVLQRDFRRPDYATVAASHPLNLRKQLSLKVFIRLIKIHCHPSRRLLPDARAVRWAKRFKLKRLPRVPKCQGPPESDSAAFSEPINVRIAGFQASRLSYRILWFQRRERSLGANNAWAAYNANSAHSDSRESKPVGGRQNLLDQDRFIQMPQSSGRYNFQFSDNEIRSVQAALRRQGIYSGQADGILGPDTKRAIEDYQVENKLPVTGQPDQGLMPYLMNLPR